MDLVDIDKVLDDLEEEIENNSTVVPSTPPPPPSSSSRLHSEPSASNRRIKVRSVLSSLNDYLDYESKLPDKSPGTILLTAIHCANPHSTHTYLCIHFRRRRIYGNRCAPTKCCESLRTNSWLGSPAPSRRRRRCEVEYDR